MNTYRRHPEVIWDTVDDEMTLCDTRDGQIYRLNHTGALIWLACQDTAASQIENTLLAAFPGHPARAMHDHVTTYLATLTNLGLISVAPQEPLP